MSKEFQCYFEMQSSQMLRLFPSLQSSAAMDGSEDGRMNDEDMPMYVAKLQATILKSIRVCMR